MSIDLTEIARRFSFHRPEGDRIDRHNHARVAYKGFADLMAWLPEGREKSLAYTALEESSFWAQAAIAREGK